MSQTKIGAIEWFDLTVPDAQGLSAFYAQVVGWQPQPVSMGDYDDYNMTQPDSGDTVTGVCHARGSNANLPAQWLMYARVADVEASAQRCIELGGEVLDGPRTMSGSNFCVIRDTAGAVLALVSD
ncbi:MAG: VOC family protein [Gammaproteobacteria bacterium]|nr:VOC family protein [Gammaproteobacteria bacterium]